MISSSDAIGIVGTMVSAISVIIVYHLFALQSWAEKSDALVDHASDVSLSSAPESMLRAAALGRVAEASKRFPWGQVILLGVGVATMAFTGASVAVMSCGLPWIVATLPLVVLCIIFVASTFLTWRRGSRALQEAQEYLG